MKKRISILLAVTMALGVLAGCGGDNASSKADDTSSDIKGTSSDTYKDGEYSVAYSAPAIDRTIDYLTVSVKGGNMSVKEYGCNEDTSGADAADDSAGGTEAEQKAREHMLEILDSYEDSGYDLNTMEIVSGAEEHTYRFIRMMRTVQKAAVSGDNAKATLGKYADGTYKTKASQANSAGWIDTLEVTVKNGEISSVVFDAQKQGDASKTITSDSEANSGSPKPSEYYPAIASGFIEAGEDMGKMFAPKGGEVAIVSFKKLMQPTLASMTTGGSTDITASNYLDGTYRAEFSNFDEFGWKDYIVVTVSRGNVKIDEFDAYSSADSTNTRSRDEELSAKMKEATGTYTIREATKKLISNWDAANEDITAVENVAGATVSSNNFKVLLAGVLSGGAAYGDTEVQIVERIASSKAA